MALGFPELLHPTRLRVNYPAQPQLPNGATGIVHHVPLSSAPLEVQPLQFRLLPMPASLPYSKFPDTCPEHRFADALFFDSLLGVLYPEGKGSAKAASTFLGPDFHGQIFFLGTMFDSNAGSVFPFFNCTAVAPVGRYLCPIGNPVRPDVPVFAAVFEE